ncbi:MAG: hypothetical protein HC844_06050 [Tabrizicola sp.]|nr:hypothetical protein [Tabrizicola sp.]
MTCRTFALILTCLAGTAGAQTGEVLDLPYLDMVETRFGTLTIGPAPLDGYEGKELLLNGIPVEGMKDAYLDIQAVLPMPDGDAQDWVLISIGGGGTGCPTLWAFVAVTPDGTRATAPFGTCSEAILDLRTTESAFLQFDMVSIAERDNALYTYTFDGAKVSEFISPRD